MWDAKTIVEVVLAFFVAIGTIVLAWVAYKGLKGTSELAESINTLYKGLYQGMFRPYVTLSMENVKFEDTSIYALIIANRGSRTASGIEFDVAKNTQGITWEDICVSLGFGPNSNRALGKGLPTIPPNQELILPFRGNEQKGFGGADFIESIPDPLNIRISYQSADEKSKYEEVYKISPRDIEIISTENIHRHKGHRED